MKLFVRADASYYIGTGHIFRTLVLAEQLYLKKWDVTYLCRELPGLPKNRISDMKFKFISLPKFKSWDEEMDFAEELIKKNRPDWWLVDHYEVCEEYYTFLRNHHVNVLAIDDINHCRFPVDILLNQNINADEYDYNCDPKTIKLLGPRWALVKAVYAQKRKQANIRMKLNRILVFMGGADVHNQTLKVIKAIALSQRKVHVDVVFGSAYQYPQTVEQFIKDQAKDNFVIHQDLNDLSDLMLKADLAIGAGGSVCWEMATMKLPMILMPIADNQLGIAQGLAKQGAAIYAGWYEETDQEGIANILRNLNDEQLQMMSAKSAGICDGMGVQMVVEQIQLLSGITK